MRLVRVYVPTIEVHTVDLDAQVDLDMEYEGAEQSTTVTDLDGNLVEQHDAELAMAIVDGLITNKD